MGIIDTMKKNLDDFKKAEWKSDYNRKVEIPKKAVVKKTTVVESIPEDDMPPTDDQGNYIKPRPYKKGGSVSSASKRADGCVTKGKTKGRFV